MQPNQNLHLVTVLHQTVLIPDLETLSENKPRQGVNEDSTKIRQQSHKMATINILRQSPFPKTKSYYQRQNKLVISASLRIITLNRQGALD